MYSYGYIGRFESLNYHRIKSVSKAPQRSRQLQSDIDEPLQPPQVSVEIEEAIQPIVANLPEGYKIETGAHIEEAGKANRALATVFPVIVLVLTVIIGAPPGHEHRCPQE